MTLIIAMGNQQQVVLVSDRRLTRNGDPYEEESNKAFVFDCQNARFALAFSGFAEQSSFLTSFWCERHPVMNR